MTKRKKVVAVVGSVSMAIAAGTIALTHGLLWGVPTRFDAGVYDVSDAEKAQSYSHGPYAKALKHVDDSGLVYYAGLKRDRAELDNYVRAIGFLKPQVYEKWDEPTQIAFWINAYNALTLKAIIDNYPIKATAAGRLAFPAGSIRQIPGVWDKIQFLVMGRKMTLNDIEHKTLRVKFNEPRIHMALVCAAMSCPPLRNEPYDGKRLSAQLDDQTRKFIGNSTKFQLDRKGRTVRLSKIFAWFSDDFVAKHSPSSGFAGHKKAAKASLHFIAGYLSAEDAAWLQNEKYVVKYLSYDWTLNERTTGRATR